MTILMASYFIRNDDFFKSQQYLAFKFSICRYYVNYDNLLFCLDFSVSTGYFINLK